MLTVNQIYKDLIALIKVALQSQSLNWQVIQSYQQTMGNIKPPFVIALFFYFRVISKKMLVFFLKVD